MGPKIENVLPTAALSKFLKGQGSRGGVKTGSNGASRSTLRSLWGHFGVILGSVSISVGDFGSIDGYFAMIVESLWVYEGPFSKSTHFLHRFL